MKKCIPEARGIRFLLSMMAMAFIATPTLAMDLDPVLVGKWPPIGREPAHAVAIQNNYLFATLNNGRFAIFDVSDPTNPQRVGGVDTGFARGLAVSGNFAYVAYYAGGLETIDVSNPANPQRVGSYNTSGLAVGVAVSGSFAYVADGDAGLT